MQGGVGRDGAGQVGEGHCCMGALMQVQDAARNWWPHPRTPSLPSACVEYTGH